MLHRSPFVDTQARALGPMAASCGSRPIKSVRESFSDGHCQSLYSETEPHHDKASGSSPLYLGTEMDRPEYLVIPMKMLPEKYVTLNNIQTHGWSLPILVPGTPIEKPTPLFKKLDDSVANEEIERMVRES